MATATTDNRSKTQRYFEALWNQRDFSVIDDWVTPDYIGHYTSRPEPVRGTAGFRAMAEELFTGVPDLRMTIEDSLVDGDRVVSRVTASGTHGGVLSGYAPTGLRVTTSFVAIERYVNGLCAEEWVYSDDLGLARQIKALPDPGSRGERLGIVLHGLQARRLRRRG
jgi:predicted ester cyclase